MKYVSSGVVALAMWKNCLACLLGVLICLAASDQLRPTVILDSVQPFGAVPSPSPAMESFPFKSRQGAVPAPSIHSAVVAPGASVINSSLPSTLNDSLTPIASWPVSSPSPSPHLSPVEEPMAVARPPSKSSPLVSIPPSHAATAAVSPSTRAPLHSPSSENPLNTSVVFPSPAVLPPSGCCPTGTVPRPGLQSESCVCVYPIALELLVEDVRTTFTNWSGVFQQDLASGLGVKVIQIEITSFQFHGSNISLVIVIDPLITVSFSPQQAESIRIKLAHFQVHLNSTLFGNYTLLSFRFYETPLLPPVQAPNVGVAPLPLMQILPQEGGSLERGRDGLRLWQIIVIVGASVAVVIVALILLWIYLVCFRSQKAASMGRGGLSSVQANQFDATASIPRSITTRLFTYEELKQATNNFNTQNVLGEGGFGRVYKGVLKDRTAVAIKRFGGGGQGDREFVVEVEMLSRLHHRNLVKLVGYYVSRDSSQHLLCYELIPNGSLEAWLHGPLGENQPLDWDQRMKIALDAGRGLAYLHEDSQPCVIHRDFKASNILIENNFHAKVADFGLAKQAPEGQTNYVATQVMGTFGYVAPEYAMTGHLLVKSDVYSYGVVLLELLSGRKPVDMSRASGQENLVTWARPVLRDKERLWELADPRLLGKYPKEDFAQVAAIAAACVAPEAGQRPTMGEVVQSLKMLQRQPDYATSGEATALADDILPSMLPTRRSFVTSIQSAYQQHGASSALESDGSSSVFSSGPFSGVAFDNETFSRSAVFSEDLHEGR